MRWLHAYLLLALALGFLAVDTAADPIWRWVDENGHVTYSNLHPPPRARDVTVIESRWAAHESRRPSTGGPRGLAQSENSELHAAYDMLLDEFYDLRGYVYDLHRGMSDPRYVLYTPEADYAYSRRYYWGPRRHRQKDFPSRRYPQQQQNHYGQRRYDRSYFSNSYRYRSSLPQFGGEQAPATSARFHRRNSAPGPHR